MLFVLFVLRLKYPVNNFSVMSRRSHYFLGITCTFFLGGGVKCFAQGHNTAEEGFEPRTLAPESDALPLGHYAPL